MGAKVHRTPEEVVQRIKDLEVDSTDFFGFQRTDLIAFLPFEYAKPWLKDDCDEVNWESSQDDPSEDGVIARMLDYMPFAWEKANNMRGLSAGRSIEHYKAWLWMLGDEMYEKFEDIGDYTHYGKPQLRSICEHFGWDADQWDDGELTNG